MNRWGVVRDQKRFWATVVAGVAGFIVLLDAVGLPFIGLAAVVPSLLLNWAATLTALALLVGLFNIAASHFMRLVRQDTDWVYSIVLLLGMLTVILTGTVASPGLDGQPIRDFFRAVYEPLAASLLALLAFFSLSAILRALQQRRAEAIVIVAVALIVLIIQLAPIAQLPFIGMATQVINDYVVLAGARGLLIGVALGTLVASMRVLLGFDQPYLDR